MIASDKFGLYETVGTLVPGVLLAYGLLILFPELRGLVATHNSAINAGAFAAVSIFIGQLVQAVASLIEPVLFFCWGGKPSVRALNSGLGDRYFPVGSMTRIRDKLVAAVKQPDATSNDLFLFAMRRAQPAPSSRVEIFNALYAYHRSLVVLTVMLFLLMVASLWMGGALAAASRSVIAGALLSDAAVLALLVFRARQRAFYYVREVLFTAEHALDSPAKA